VRDFVLWAPQADKFTGAKNLPGPRLPVNRVTGKKGSDGPLRACDDQPHVVGGARVLRVPP
jgi:hypothetical protein